MVALCVRHQLSGRNGPSTETPGSRGYDAIIPSGMCGEVMIPFQQKLIEKQLSLRVCYP
jgi:hypothetical protein